MIIPATENVKREQIEMVIDKVENTTSRKNHSNNIPVDTRRRFNVYTTSYRR